MSVSSTNSILTSLISQYYYQPTVTNTNTTTTATTDTTSIKGVNSLNSDGDTFQLSGQLPTLAPMAYTSTGASTDSISSSELFSHLDSDGDGVLSSSEFLAARPDDVTEEMAANLYASFDTDSSGSLTESEYQAAMRNNPAPPSIA